MNLGDARIGVVIGVKVFAEFFDEAYERGLIPHTITKDAGAHTFEVTLNRPEFRAVAKENRPAYTRLELSGHVTKRSSVIPTLPPSLDEDFEVSIKLGLALKPRSGQAPLVVFELDGIDEPPESLELTVLFAAALSNPELTGALASLELDLITPVVEGLEPIYYPKADPPPRDAWGTATEVLVPMDSSHWAGIGIFVSEPDKDARPALTSSPLPALMGLQFIYSKSLLNHVLEASSKEQVGKDVGEGDEAAHLDSLSLSMGSDSIQIKGKASKDGATITFEGPVYPSLARGTTSLIMDTSEVSVDVDMPWYYSFGYALAAILFFVPGLNLLDLALLPALFDAGAAAAAAPATVRRGLASGLADGMSALAAGLAVDLDGSGPIDVDSTTDHLAVIDGNMLFAAQVFVSVVESPIVNASYSKLQRRFVEYELADGRKFLYSELARLCAKGKVVCPGFHDVEGKYMRSNPDSTTANNLGDQFER